MTATRKCKQCGKHLITHRADARFCNEICRARWNNKRRAEGRATDIRIEGGSGSEGSCGGHVRSVQEARELQEANKEKARWTLICREHIARTLLETNYFHADDMVSLGVPEEHCNIIGSQIASFVNRKLMAKVGERRCTHKAANSRKAAIYQITTLGRERLARMGSEHREGTASRNHGSLDRPAVTADEATDPTGARSSLAAHSGENPAGIDVDVPQPQGEGGPNRAQAHIGVDPGESRTGGRGEPLPGFPGAAVKAPGSASPEQLFELPPERPRSAWTDEEMAA